MDQSRWMDILAIHGPAMLKAVVRNSSDHDSDPQTFVEALADFLRKNLVAVRKLGYIPNTKVLLTLDPLPAMPPELYRQDVDILRRRRLFFRHLMRRDILYLQVINDDVETYKCLILAKHGDMMYLNDLSLAMHFPKLDAEMKLLGRDVRKFDLIRGAFWSCDPWERKMFVTLDTKIFSEEDKEKIPKLGKITRKDLPHYVCSGKIGMTYAGYVERSAGYKGLGNCPNLLNECLGTDVKSFSSFFSKRNKKTYPAPESLAVLQKKLYPDASVKKLIKSFEAFRTGDVFKALYYANKAVMLNPDNIQARVTRGTAFANLGKLKSSFVDTEDSLKLDPNNEAAKRQMSELLVTASKIYLVQKNYLMFHNSLVLAKRYNPNNHEAREILMKIQYESRPATAFNPEPLELFIPPRVAEVSPVYNRIVQKVDKRRLLKKYKKQHREKRRRERRHHFGHQKRRPLAMSRPIPTTTTTRRKVSLRSRSPVFRRPLPPRNIPRI